MQIKFCIFLIILFWEKVNGNEDSDFNMILLVSKYGYFTETHEVETEDGYILDIYRILVDTKSRSRKINRQPVLLVHGLLGSAENFILAGPNKSLSYMLANIGYDVWLINVRGTWHSKKHKTLNSDTDKEYWQFTWHEIGLYDIPATIDYVLKVTNMKKLHYIGHSQGSTVFHVMCSERPEYNNKVKVHIALSPAVFLKRIKQPIIKFFSGRYKVFEVMLENAHQYQFPPIISSKDIRHFLKYMCESKSGISVICNLILSVLFGMTPDDLDPGVMALLAATTPASASFKQLFHFGQVVVEGEFKNYDWGKTENIRRYHTEKPPLYNLENVKCPVAVFYGEGDEVVVKEDVEILIELLPNVILKYLLPDVKWGHFHFLIAKNVDTLLNDKIIEVLKLYNVE